MNCSPLSMEKHGTGTQCKRSFATRNQKRASMKDIQEHLRHARIETTGNVYVHAIPESVRSMVEADITDVLTPVVVN
jgi:integrase